MARSRFLHLIAVTHPPSTRGAGPFGPPWAFVILRQALWRPVAPHPLRARSSPPEPELNHTDRLIRDTPPIAPLTPNHDLIGFLPHRRAVAITRIRLSTTASSP